MCYFLYGAVNEGINTVDYDKVIKDSEYHFAIGDEDAVNSCVENCQVQYRITFNHCDCDTPLAENR